MRDLLVVGVEAVALSLVGRAGGHVGVGGDAAGVVIVVTLGQALGLVGGAQGHVGAGLGAAVGVELVAVALDEGSADLGVRGAGRSGDGGVGQDGGGNGVGELHAGGGG